MPEREQPVSAIDVLSQYVQRRRYGLEADKALAEIKVLIEQINSAERAQLVNLIRSWEAREGAKYRSLRPVEAIDPPNDSANDKNAINKKPAQVSKPPPALVRPDIKADEQIVCPHCGKKNRVGEVICHACGHMLKPSRASTRALPINETDDGRKGTAHFGRFSRICLYVAGSTEPIELEPSAEIVIGRSTSDSALRPDVDLASYRGEDMGVSRLHATLKRQENTVSITDLGSLNHTYINGQLLHPQEVRVLYDGDEVRLGRLAIQVKFKQQLRRLE